MPWYILALLSALCFSVNIIVIKYALNLGLSGIVIMFFLYAGGAVCYLAHVLLQNQSLNLAPKILIMLLATGFLSYLGNYFQVTSILTAANPGYTAAIVATNGAIVTIASYYLFKSDLSTIKFLGVLSCVIGVALLSLPVSNQNNSNNHGEKNNYAESESAR